MTENFLTDFDPQNFERRLIENLFLKVHIKLIELYKLHYVCGHLQPGSVESKPFTEKHDFHVYDRLQ